MEAYAVRDKCEWVKAANGKILVKFWKVPYKIFRKTPLLALDQQLPRFPRLTQHIHLSLVFKS